MSTDGIRFNWVASVSAPVSGSATLTKELNRTEAAEYLGVSPRTLDYWASKRMGPDFRRRGRRAFYDKSDLDRWSDKHQLRKMQTN